MSDLRPIRASEVEPNGNGFITHSCAIWWDGLKVEQEFTDIEGPGGDLQTVLLFRIEGPGNDGNDPITIASHQDRLDAINLLYLASRYEMAPADVWSVLCAGVG